MTKTNLLSFPESFENSVKQVLLAQPSVKEFDLMKHLVNDGFEEFAMSLDELKMFRSHFLLFHFLYQLQDKWHQQHFGWLDIHTLSISLNHYSTTPSQNPLPAGEQSLREYYLNLDNLTATTQEDVVNLIESFWQKFSQIPPQSSCSSEQMAQDLKILELPPNEVCLQQIKQQRKKLLQQHHPDKGGDALQFQTILDASNRLQDYVKDSLPLEKS